MRRLPLQIEMPDDDMVAVLRSKSPSQKLAMGFAMWNYARKIVIAALRTEHPDWSDHQILREAASRMSHGAV